VVGRTSRHHGWANPGNREEPALGSARTDGARLVACHRPQGKAWHVEKRKEVEAFVPTRIRELGFGCPHVEVQLQKSVGDVWSQISSAYALQKERTGSSERGPRSARRSAGETVGRHAERKERRESASPVEDGRGPAQGSGWREIVIQRSQHRQKRGGGRGPGVVMATGSYEESLSMEGIPDHHGAIRSRGALTSGLGGHRILATRANLPKGDTRRQRSSRETTRGARGRDGRDRGVRGSIASASWEDNAHAYISSRETLRSS
jgi:hypothetical protein